MESSFNYLEQWSKSHGSTLIKVREHLEREDEIFTAPTLVAVSNKAFALDAWIPTSKADEVKSKLSKYASHVSIEAYVDDHHHHDGGDEPDNSPKELSML